MRKEYKKPFYVPASGAQKFEFYVGTENTLTVIREEQWFYQLEQDGQKKALGNLVSTCQYLYRCRAEWITKEARRKRMFYNRETAVQMLREGYTVVHVESGNRLSYTGDYLRIVCSSSIVLDNDVPPGNFCIDFTEPKLLKTYKEMKIEQKRLNEEKDRVEREAKKAATKEAVREFLQQQQLMSNKTIDKVSNVKSKREAQSGEKPEAKKTGFGWKDFAWIGVGVVGCILLSPLFNKKDKKTHSYRVAG